MVVPQHSFPISLMLQLLHHHSRLLPRDFPLHACSAHHTEHLILEGCRQPSIEPQSSYQKGQYIAVEIEQALYAQSHSACTRTSTPNFHSSLVLFSVVSIRLEFHRVSVDMVGVTSSNSLPPRG
ncbi:hypothetical protein NEOLEDRAFT_149355 [Neolentinus lepideus HHB14362 ss-1]|uniref:Uncharacterized protein n=1 Tax=Neolentinus lepideus HHB14362 ss-1 TaxID=1314782 RepID=A0A165MND0_9AGAM|nr:hypothetical protein NEOLEDRAFT_149355 [Neolentinus lepideus HHB14362 ss-1]